MPRGPRIDAPGVLHHVWARGVERKKIFLSDADRLNFLERLEQACEDSGAHLYAWCLMSNHFHLAIRTGERPLSKVMRSVLTGYAMYFNRRHKRSGHLFQNRYKSTIVDDEQYFLALVRYIHLNPVRARIVDSVDALKSYPWSGHAVLLGMSSYSVQEVDAVLRRFGARMGAARKGLAEFMISEDAKAEKKTFEGGGLRRSAGGEKNLVKSDSKEKWAHDDRILGSSSFVESVLKMTDTAPRFGVMSEEEKWAAFDRLNLRLSEEFGVNKAELKSGSKRRLVSEVRQLLSYGGTRHLGLTAAALAPLLGVSSQAVLKGANKAQETWDELDDMIKESLE